MGDIVVEARNVYKKFKRGETYSSLRDLIPALFRRSLQGGAQGLEQKEFWALRDVSFQVRAGEAFGIIGHNGAGKSTILKHLSGIMKPTSGTLSVKGRLSALIEVGAGFHPDLTGRENIFLYGTILGMSREEVRKKFDAIVDFSGLEEFIDTPVKRFSSGMFARLGFAVSVHVEPDVLIIDEVLSVGDFLFQKKSVDKMKAIVGGGTTVLFVSHNMRAVAGLCQRAVLMERGQVTAAGPTGEVIRAYLERNRQTVHEDKDVYISSVELLDESGPSTHFESGQVVTAEIEVRANRPTRKVAVVIECCDEEQYELFNTSSQRLGEPPFDIEPGEIYRVTFQMTLHLAPGTYNFGVYLYRYDAQKNYDTRVPARTFYVSCPIDVKGSVNLQPRLIGQERLGQGGVQARLVGLETRAAPETRLAPAEQPHRTGSIVTAEPALVHPPPHRAMAPGAPRAPWQGPIDGSFSLSLHLASGSEADGRAPPLLIADHPSFQVTGTFSLRPIGCELQIAPRKETVDPEPLASPASVTSVAGEAMSVSVPPPALAFGPAEGGVSVNPPQPRGRQQLIVAIVVGIFGGGLAVTGVLALRTPEGEANRAPALAAGRRPPAQLQQASKAVAPPKHGHDQAQRDLTPHEERFSESKPARAPATQAMVERVQRMVLEGRREKAREALLALRRAAPSDPDLPTLEQQVQGALGRGEVIIIGEGAAIVNEHAYRAPYRLRLPAGLYTINGRSVMLRSGATLAVNGVKEDGNR